MRLMQGGQPEHSKMSRNLMAGKVCADRLQNIEMDVQRLKNHHKLQQLRLRDAPWRSASQLSGPISFLQLASAESESRASGKQKPKVTPETPGLLNRKFEHRLDRSS